MTRILALVAGALVVLVLAVVLLRGGDAGPSGYRIQLDNTFGLTKGADVRVAGVKVGSVRQLDVEARSARAILDVDIQRPEFGGLRRDAFCTVRPQSLIGEYFLDCDPGVSRRRLPAGGTLPVDRTAGTIPPDLVLDVLRRPYRERLGILLSELGGSFAARGGDVNTAIGRAIPALRQTDQVLALLAGERATLTQLTRDAATTLRPLAAQRQDLARFVTTAARTAAASADRRTQLAATVHDLPAFQTELRQTLRELGTTAAAQTPALQALRTATPQLSTLLRRLGPFATATRPFISSLGRTSTVGIRAARAARPTVRELRTLARSTLEPATNLRFVLEHLDDRANAVEPNPASPGGKGFTGLEALLQYPFEQSQAINLFDNRGYLLKIALLINECSAYTDAASARSNPGRTKRCSAALGPGGPLPAARAAARPATKQQGAKDGGQTLPAADTQAAPAPAAPATPTAPPAAPPASSGPALKLPGLPPITLPGGGGGGSSSGTPDGLGGLLDYLLGS